MLEAFDDIDLDWLLNTDRLELQGKYVLVDFWTYSCINCVRTVPQIEEIHEKISHQDLVVVGVHTPEFDFEKIPGNVSRAIKELGITYPVVLDQEYYLWAYFNNQYWPAHYLFDREGELVFESIGEEGTDELVKVINGMVQAEIAVKSRKKSENERITHEIYLGKNRGELGNSAECNGDSCNIFFLPEDMEKERPYLKGKWEQHGQFIESLEGESSIYLDFKGTSISGVFDSDSEAAITCSIGGETSKVTINGPNTYPISEQGYLEENLVITVPKGVRVFTLTFG